MPPLASLLRGRPMRRGRRWPIELGPRGRRLCAALAAVIVALFVADQAFAPPIARARIASPVVVDKDEVWLAAFLTPDGKWRLAADLDEIDPEYVRRLIALEDARFFWHPGVDPLAAGRALVSLVREGEATSGASTITMQLVRLLEPRPRTIPSKLIEMVRAVQIERRLSKREILEAYLTLAPYGGNLEGVRAASRAYFQRDPKGLSDAEIALLLALPQAPEGRRPDRRPQAALNGRNAVLDKLVRAGAMTPSAAREASTAPLEGRSPFPVRARLFAKRLAAETPGAPVIRSTLDARLQMALEALARAHAERLGGDVSVAIVAVEIEGRAIRASVGGVGQDRPGGWIDMTRAVRSPGSTLKPFIYGLAFDDGIAAPETLLEDAPRRFGGYLPENFDRRFHGEVRLDEALQQSLNLPAVATLDRIGAGRFAAALREAGAPPRLPPGPESAAGLALALGGAGLTLEELTTLYAALGDGGEARPLVSRADDRAGRAHRLMSQESANRIAAILAAAPAPDGRAPSLLTADAPRIAFKTGTSYAFRDAWCFGVAGGWAVGVWVGRADAAPRPGATGRRDAAPILFEAFDAIAPQGLSGPLADPAWRERPAPGLARFETATAEEQGPAILFPPDGAVVRVDALGDAGRGVALAARGGAGGLAWYAEGAEIAPEPQSGRVVWRPSGEGFFTVSVIDAEGRRASARVRVRAGG